MANSEKKNTYRKFIPMYFDCIKHHREVRRTQAILCAVGWTAGRSLTWFSKDSAATLLQEVLGVYEL